MRGFDRVAPCYDVLARLVFGQAIVSAQEHYLSEIKDGDRILILGGGTGWILDSIFKISSPAEVWYIDSSPGMIERARARVRDRKGVYFVTGTIDQVPAHVSCNVVITNFFLDMFSDEQLPVLIVKILKRASSKGIWLCSDFTDTGKWFHQTLLKAMYLFFGLLTGLVTSLLPDWQNALLQSGVVPVKEKRFYNGFIRSVLFILP